MEIEYTITAWYSQINNAIRYTVDCAYNEALRQRSAEGWVYSSLSAAKRGIGRAMRCI